MMITVTDKGMAPHVYARSCKCRGCVAVRKARIRAGLLTIPAAAVVGALVGWFGGSALGPFTGIAAAIMAVGVFMRLSPSVEVLKDEPEDSE